MTYQEFKDKVVISLLTGKATDFYTAAHRKNIGTEKNEEWIHLTSEEATELRIVENIKMAFRIADIAAEQRETNRLEDKD